MNYPVPPPPAGGGEPGTSFYTHHFFLTWSNVDLQALKSLTVNHSRGIQVVTGAHVTELQLILQLDIQKQDHARLADEYEREARSASSIPGERPVVKLPTRQCAEDRDHRGELVRVREGVCVRGLQIVVPATKVLELDLAHQGSASVEGVEVSKLTMRLPAEGTTRLTRVRGDVTLLGGGAGAKVKLLSVMPPSEAGSGPTGALLARLSTVSELELQNVRGRVLLFVDRPAGARVTLDGRLITDFPYERP